MRTLVIKGELARVKEKLRESRNRLAAHELPPGGVYCAAQLLYFGWLVSDVMAFKLVF
ncbi:hypothetical protein DEO72_LG11g2125 [Vigna unguiculata]|uniref:Uncharacterized protein n=1 Tax=Vigna unguiculata TaxID=3917 RepID=A0A4D6NTN7_VIGUN|nr:hypothetical protein DEO72_LG11g2125 [Vigna unguiculata]